MIIREVGKFAVYNSSTTLGGNADNGTNARVSVMIDRTVLATPVVIPDGESGVLRLDYVYG